MKKSAKWLWFWLAFMATPVLTWLCAPVMQAGVLSILALGSLIAGCLLASVFYPPAKVPIMGLLFTIGIIVVYAALAFAGCAVMMSH